MPDASPHKAAEALIASTTKVFYTETDKTVCFIDVETGGLTPDCSLLSLGLACWVDGTIRDQQEWLIKYPIYHVTAEGLEVNRINLVDHHRKALTSQQAATAIREWTDNTFHPMSRITLGGHNLALDVAHLDRLLNLHYPSYYSKRFSYRTIDTSTLLIFLNHAGLTPPLQGLERALKFFGVEVKGPRHTALWDTVATADLYTAIREFVREKLL